MISWGLTLVVAWLVSCRGYVRVLNALLGSVCSTKSGDPSQMVRATYTQDCSAPVDGTLEEGVGFEPTYLFGVCPKCSPMNYPPSLSYSVDGGTRRAVRLCRTGRT